ncbi:energy transducer TonB [Sphingomonas sp. PB4P5]|uniref:energy transducer TonB n=1 Tax=Parasphingomonas puruogangriensis TaxID=3096155 RepID=UPI002FCACBC4
MLVVLNLLQAVTAPVLQPVSRWVVSYNETECSASRSFGDPEHPVVVTFVPYPTNKEGYVYFSVPGRATNVRIGAAAVQLMPTGETSSSTVVGAKYASGSHVIRLFADEALWANIYKSSALKISGTRRDDLFVTLQGIQQIRAAAKTCGDDLLKSWGADPSAMVYLKPKNGTSPFWFTNNDYPINAIENDEEGRLQSLTSIDRDGKPIACRVVAKSGSETLDVNTCRLLVERIRAPAVGPEGPATRYFYHAVTWKLPRN